MLFCTGKRLERAFFRQNPVGVRAQAPHAGVRARSGAGSTGVDLAEPGDDEIHHRNIEHVARHLGRLTLSVRRRAASIVLCCFSKRRVMLAVFALVRVHDCQLSSYLWALSAVRRRGAQCDVCRLQKPWVLRAIFI